MIAIHHRFAVAAEEAKRKEKEHASESQRKERQLKNEKERVAAVEQQMEHIIAAANTLREVALTRAYEMEMMKEKLVPVIQSRETGRSILAELEQALSLDQTSANEGQEANGVGWMALR